MSLTGPFFNAVNEDENIYEINNITVPGSVELGVIPADYIFEELKCIVTIPAPAGTTFKLTDQQGNVLIQAGKISVDRAVSTTANVNKRITGQVKLSALFDAPSLSSSNCEIVFIKKICCIP